jgi:hypothetical protein
MEELNLEGDGVVSPDGSIGAEAEIAPAVEIDLEKPVRDLGSGLLERGVRQSPGSLGDGCQVEGACDLGTSCPEGEEQEKDRAPEHGRERSHSPFTER